MNTNTITAGLKHGLLLAGAAALVVACSTEAADANAPGVDEDVMGEQATISFAGWGATANAPIQSRSGGQILYGEVQAAGQFTGAQGSTKGAGFCLTKMLGTPCTPYQQSWDVTTKKNYIEGQCGTPTSYGVTGGYMYCIAVDNSGPTYCAIRPGTQAAWCVGTPNRLGGGTDPDPVIGQTVSSNGEIMYTGGSGYTNVRMPLSRRKYVDPDYQWVSLGCISGCNGEANSATVSSPAIISCKTDCSAWSGAGSCSYCVDSTCAGYPDYCVMTDGSKQAVY